MQKIKNQLLGLVAIVLISGVAGAEAEDVRLSKEGGVYHLPVRINDAIELLFIVDTGAADVHIPADVALTLMRTGTISKADFLGTAEYQMADGTISENAKLRLSSLKIGSTIIRNVEASIGPVAGSLLLGQSALRKIEPWSMDTKRSLLIFGDSVGKKEGSQSTINNNVIKLSCDNLKARELEDYEDYENHLANLDKLAKLANLDYLSRYDAGIVDYLCEGDIKQLELEIDYGYVKLSTVEKIKEILGLNNIKINGVRSKEGIKYEKTHDILINMGLCTACASNAAEQYVKKPNTNCAKLVKKALAGEKSAFNQLDSDRNICQ